MNHEERNEIHFIEAGKRQIFFDVVFRKRKDLSISVHPDQSVSVVAPEECTMQEVKERVNKRAAWIIKQQLYFDQFRPLPPPLRYVSGETHRYLGRQYRLKLVEAEWEEVKLIGRFLYVYLRDREASGNVKALLNQWYRDHARDIFRKRLETCLESAVSLQLPPPNIVIRTMKKRWGSCTRTGNILLNLELIKTPLYCIEYVIMHELCHLRVHDHSDEFYRLLSRCMPDWKRRKERLDSFVL